jgi:hypothetical protein
VTGFDRYEATSHVALLHIELHTFTSRSLKCLSNVTSARGQRKVSLSGLAQRHESRSQVVAAKVIAAQHSMLFKCGGKPVCSGPRDTSYINKIKQSQ